ncbi:hypothetical protein [Moorena sp. SIO3B2]|uniref:hypothetical protein n=1 Tax=Moorena sp. SIO3B2 TaxID=2607827 RepID=UPI0013C5ECD3|nr:hypothetical protein [Moorena sp. SIO3B2]NEP37361.1 hypothetical protein [Moorena sp. SIO3B2]
MSQRSPPSHPPDRSAIADLVGWANGQDSRIKCQTIIICPPYPTTLRNAITYIVGWVKAKCSLL